METNGEGELGKSVLAARDDDDDDDSAENFFYTTVSLNFLYPL